MPENTIEEKVIAYLRQEETNYTEAAQLGEAALPILRNIIKGSNVALASKATSLVGYINSDQRAEVLLEAAKHPSEIVRVAAAGASQNLPTNQAEIVIEQLINDSDVGVSKFTLKSVKAKNLSAKFSDKIRSISDKHPQESIQMMAKEMLDNQ